MILTLKGQGIDIVAKGENDGESMRFTIIRQEDLKVYCDRKYINDELGEPYHSEDMPYECVSFDIVSVDVVCRHDAEMMFDVSDNFNPALLHLCINDNPAFPGVVANQIEYNNEILWESSPDTF